MLVNADVSGLELYTAADWYGDEVLKAELLANKNVHEDTQRRFNLPQLVIAKIFSFRLLYGSSSFGFARDADFMSVGYNADQWDDVIEEFYTKYPGIKKGQIRDIQFAKENGFIEIPSGRHFNFRPKTDKWPESLIKNYPIQGGGADLVKLARIEAFKRFLDSGMEGFFIQTIHDSLVYDVPENNVDAIAKILYESIAKVPEMCYTIWNYKFSLPLRCKIEVGPNKRNMIKYQLKENNG
jgi:DNA polymerase-1